MLSKMKLRQGENRPSDVSEGQKKNNKSKKMKEETMFAHSQTWRTALIIISLLISALLSAQAVPNLIDYQGRITDSDGNPINGTVSITFSIYADSTGGTSLWSETQDPVNVSDGLFHLFLGAENPIPDTLFNEPERWIGIDVNNDGEMTPRSMIGSVAYAQTDGDWVVDGDDIYRENGKVGIGTTSPGAKLDIKQSTDSNEGGLIIRHSLGDITGRLWMDANGLHIQKGWDNDNQLYLLNNGNIGIGTTSPVGKLEILQSTDDLNGGIRINDSGQNFLGRIWMGNGGNTLNIQNGPSVTAMSIDNSGNVGIGTSIPEAKLHVAGTPGTDGIMFPDGTIQTTAATQRTYDSGWFAISSGGNPTLYTKTHNLGTTMVISQCWLSDTSDGSGISVLVQGGHTLNTGGDWGHADSHLEGLTTTQISLYVQNKLHDGRLNTTSGYARIIMLALE